MSFHRERNDISDINIFLVVPGLLVNEGKLELLSIKPKIGVGNQIGIFRSTSRFSFPRPNGSFEKFPNHLLVSHVSNIFWDNHTVLADSININHHWYVGWLLDFGKPKPLFKDHYSRIFFRQIVNTSEINRS